MGLHDFILSKKGRERCLFVLFVVITTFKVDKQSKNSKKFVNTGSRSRGIR